MSADELDVKSLTNEQLLMATVAAIGMAVLMQLAGRKPNTEVVASAAIILAEHVNECGQRIPDHPLQHTPIKVK